MSEDGDNNPLLPEEAVIAEQPTDNDLTAPTTTTAEKLRDRAKKNEIGLSVRRRKK